MEATEDYQAEGQMTIFDFVEDTTKVQPIFSVGDRVKVKGADAFEVKTVEDKWAVSVYGDAEGEVIEVHESEEISYLIAFPVKRECYFNANELIKLR